MSYKTFEVDGLGSVTVYKRRGARSLRLSLANNGGLKLIMPIWASYRFGLNFVASQKEWVSKQPRQVNQLTHGMKIGKRYNLIFQEHEAPKIRTKVELESVIIYYPAHLNHQSAEVQESAKKTSIKALRRDTEDLILPRLKELAEQYGFTYRGGTVKHLKARWGSCNNQGDITLSLFLAQLPWPLIDYVLLHELMHTKVFGHGPKFWNAMNQHLSDVKELRKQIRSYRPAIIDSGLSE